MDRILDAHVRDYDRLGHRHARRKVAEYLLAQGDIIVGNKTVLLDARDTALALWNVREKLAPVIDRPFWHQIRKGRLIAYRTRKADSDGQANNILEPICYGRLRSRTFLAPWFDNFPRKIDRLLASYDGLAGEDWVSFLACCLDRELGGLPSSIDHLNWKADVLIEKMRAFQAFADNASNDALTRWNEEKNRVTPHSLRFTETGIEVARAEQELAAIDIPSAFSARLGTISAGVGRRPLSSENALIWGLHIKWG